MQDRFPRARLLRGLKMDAEVCECRNGTSERLQTLSNHLMKNGSPRGSVFSYSQCTLAAMLLQPQRIGMQERLGTQFFNSFRNNSSAHRPMAALAFHNAR